MDTEWVEFAPNVKLEPQKLEPQEYADESRDEVIHEKGDVKTETAEKLTRTSQNVPYSREQTVIKIVKQVTANVGGNHKLTLEVPYQQSNADKQASVLPAIKIEHCGECNMEFSSRSERRSHCLTSGHNSHKCECGALFKNIRALNSHLKATQCNKTTKVNVACEFCSKASSQTSALRKHLSSHGKHSLPCEICQNYFELQDYWKVHMRSKHEARKFYPMSKLTCKKCLKKFSNATSLDKHTKGHSIIQCHSCQKKFQQYFLQQHHYNDHIEPGPFTCTVCRKPCQYKPDTKIPDEIIEEEIESMCWACFEEQSHKTQNQLIEHNAADYKSNKDDPSSFLR